MASKKKYPWLAFLGVTALGLGVASATGCEDDGPMENAGESVDDAADDAADAVDDAADNVDDAVDDATDGN